MRLTPDEVREIMVEIDRKLIANAESMRAIGIPEYWIAKPDTRQFAPLIPGKKRNELFGAQRNHARGHGWKANHES